MLSLYECSTLMKHAAGELRRLREDNVRMQAQLDVVEVFKAALLGPPIRSSMAMEPDIVFALDREAEKCHHAARKEDEEKGEAYLAQKKAV